MRRIADRSMRGLAWLLMHSFYRSIEVEHADRLPLDRPVLLVGNHTNGVADAVMLMFSLPRYPRFLGKSTLFHIPPLYPFLKWAGVVPLYRAREGGNAERNAGAFRTSRQVLARRGIIAIFPEGEINNGSTLQPMRTGAARIALSAAAEGSTDGLTIVPVGLIYDNKSRFRSRALVQVGEPFEVAPWVEQYRADDHAAVRALTDAIGAALQRVCPDYESLAQAALLGQLADIANTGGLPGGRAGAGALASRERTAQALAVLEASSGGGPQVVGELRARYGEYQRELEGIGLTDQQLATVRRTPDAGRRAAVALLQALVALPLAVVGVAVHVVPYLLMKLVARLAANEGVKSTVKILGCMLLFAGTYVTAGVLVGQHLGWLAGIGAFFACPACGYLTVWMVERAHQARALLAGSRAVRDRGAEVQGLVDRREEMAAGVQAALAHSS